MTATSSQVTTEGESNTPPGNHGMLTNACSLYKAGKHTTYIQTIAVQVTLAWYACDWVSWDSHISLIFACTTSDVSPTAASMVPHSESGPDENVTTTSGQVTTGEGESDVPSATAPGW